MTLPYASRHVHRRCLLKPVAVKRLERRASTCSPPLLVRIHHRALGRGIGAPGNSLFRIVAARRPVLGLARARARGFWARPAPRPVTMVSWLLRVRRAR